MCNTLVAKWVSCHTITDRASVKNNTTSRGVTALIFICRVLAHRSSIFLNLISHLYCVYIYLFRCCLLIIFYCFSSVVSFKNLEQFPLYWAKQHASNARFLYFLQYLRAVQLHSTVPWKCAPHFSKNRAVKSVETSLSVHTRQLFKEERDGGLVPFSKWVAFL